jgi:uncharacterized protein (DUF2267 family)
MSVSGLAVFDEAMQKTNTWLKEISETLGSDRHRAYQVLRAVLHCLRNRLTVDEVADLGDQLPMLVRGIYYEAGPPPGNPVKIRSQEDFLAQIAAHLMHAHIEPEDAARAVFQVLENHITREELDDILEELPLNIRALWPGAKPPSEAFHSLFPRVP